MIMPFFGPVPTHTVNTWAEHTRKKGLHKVGLILYMWNKRGLSWTRKYKHFDAFFTVSLMCSFHDKLLVIITPSSSALLTTSSWLPFTRIGWNSDCFLVKGILSSLHFSLFSWTLLSKDHWDTQSAICCAPPLATTSDIVMSLTYFQSRALKFPLRLRSLIKIRNNQGRSFVPWGDRAPLGVKSLS